MWRSVQQLPKPTTCSLFERSADVDGYFSGFNFIIEIYMIYFQHFSGEWVKGPGFEMDQR
jgi:hypothetical protein